jgi:hypothetical protein
VEIQHYDPTPEYTDDDDDESDGGDLFHFYDASDRMWETNEDSSGTTDGDETSTSSSSVSNSHRNSLLLPNSRFHDNYNDISTDHIDVLGLPMVNTTTTSRVGPLFHRGLEEEEDHNSFRSPLGRGRGGRGRHLYRNPLINDNLQGYTDLTDFATLTDSSNSDTDSSCSHGSVFLLSSPQQQQQPRFIAAQQSPTHQPSPRHSNLAEQLLSSSNVPPLENIIVDEYDVSSSSSGSDFSDLHHPHFVDPNLYPLQHHQPQHRVAGDNHTDEHGNPEYYFEVQSLDSCFLPGIYPSRFNGDRDTDDDDGNDDTTSRRHPHYRMSILKQRFRDSVMAVPLSLARFRRDSMTSSSREETEVEVSSSIDIINNNTRYSDTIVQAEAILLPYVLPCICRCLSHLCCLFYWENFVN